MQWKRIISLALVICALSGKSNVGFACSDGGCDSWGGLYSVGDYNLYNFGLDIYGLSADSGYENYGGGCGSLISGCSGGYDQAGLYGSDWGLGTSSGFSLDLDISIYASLDPSSWYTNQNQGGYDLGCGIGYCGSGDYLPYYSDNYPSTTPWNSPIDLYTPSYSSPFSPVGYNPFDQFPTAQPPIPPPPTTSIPPWMGCDNVVIPCPTGPTSRFEPSIDMFPRQPYQLPRDPGLPRPNIPMPPPYSPTHDPIFDPLPPMGGGPGPGNFPIGPAPSSTSYIDVMGAPSSRTRVPRDPFGPAPVFPTGSNPGGTTNLPNPGSNPMSPQPQGSSTTDYLPVGRNPVRVPRSGF